MGAPMTTPLPPAGLASNDRPMYSRGTPSPSAIRDSTSYAMTSRPWMIAETSGCDWPVSAAIFCWLKPTFCSRRYTREISRTASADRISGRSHSSGSTWSTSSVMAFTFPSIIGARRLWN